LENNKEACRKNIKYAYKKFQLILNTDPISIGGDWLGQMVSYPLPKSCPSNLKELLWNNYKIEIPIFEFNNDMYIRISMQIYNDKNDVDYLMNALDNII